MTPKPQLHNSPLCRSRIHCRNCRSIPATRGMLIETYQVAGVQRGGFECPEGFTADTVPDYRASIEDSLPARRMEICTACDQTDCGIKHQTKCRRRAILTRDNFHCPRQRF